jgi:hypothetical protein
MTKKVPDTAVRDAAKSRSLSSLAKLPNEAAVAQRHTQLLEEVKNHDALGQGGE